jgi:hypothetical protein
MQQKEDADVHFPVTQRAGQGTKHVQPRLKKLGHRRRSQHSCLMAEPEPSADRTLLTLWRQRCEVAETDRHPTNKISLSRSAACVFHR